MGEEINDHETNFPIPQRKYVTQTDNGAGKANCSCSAFQQKNTLVTKVVNQRRLNHFMTFPETSLFNI